MNQALSTPMQEHVSPGRMAWLRLRANRAAVAGMIFLVLIGAACFAAPFLPLDPGLQNLALGATSPTQSNWLGTDTLGRDLLARLLYGGRISLMVGIAATLVSLLIGTIYGAIAGYAGGRVDRLLMRLVDILYAMPFTVFVIVLIVAFGQSLLLLFIAIGAVEWLTMSRIVRGQVLFIKQQTYVKAARVLGFGRRRILLRHIMPNIIGPVVIYTTLTVPRVILLESFLSFLGLGVQPPASTWGSLIRDGAEAMETFPWLLIFPAVALSITLFALNFVGDGLRDALDPRYDA